MSDSEWSGSLAIAADAEAALIGAMLLAPETVLRIGKLTADDFSDIKHRAVFKGALAVCDRGDPLDTVTLEAELAKQGTLESAGGIAGLSGYLIRSVTSANASHYAGIIRDQAFSRRLRLAASGVVSRLGAGADWTGELVGLRRALEELEDGAHVDAPTLRQAMETELAAIKNNRGERVGLSTGLGLERVVPTGVPLDKVTTVFAETGHLKTTFINNMAWNMAAAGHSVLSISWEDSTQLGAQRALSRGSGVGYGRLAARAIDVDERSKLLLRDPEVADRIVMEDSCEPSIDAVIRLARYYKRTKNVAAVFVDYLQLIDGQGSQKQVLDDAIQKAQRSAKQDRVAYVFVSQVKAEVTGRKPEDGGPRPVLDDCLGSSAMRIGTKLGLGLFRPYRYCRVPPAKGAYSEYNALAARWPEGKEVFLRDLYPNLVEVNVTKNVVGEAPVTVLCKVDLPTGRFEPFNAGF